MKFHVFCVAPDEAPPTITPQQTVLPPETFARLYEQSKAFILKGKDFARQIALGGVEYIVYFKRSGSTAAQVAFVRGNAARLDKVDAIAALLSGLDDAEDARLLASLRSRKSLGFCKPDEWKKLAATPRPAAITFFVEAAAVNNRALQGLVPVLATAFFDQFGIGGEE